MNVCLIGATGLIGSEVLKKLTADQRVQKIFCIGRRAPVQVNSKINFIKAELVDLIKLSPPAAEPWVCCLGTTIKTAVTQENFKKVDYEAAVQFSQLAKRAGAQSLHIISALGADESSKVFYNRVKGEMQKAVAQLDLPSVYFYQPSLLLGERKDFRLGESIAIKLAPLYSALLLGPLKAYRPIRAEQVSAAVCANLLNPSVGVHFVTNEEMLVVQ